MSPCTNALDDRKATGRCGRDALVVESEHDDRSAIAGCKRKDRRE